MRFSIFVRMGLLATFSPSKSSEWYKVAPTVLAEEEKEEAKEKEEITEESVSVEVEKSVEVDGEEEQSKSKEEMSWYEKIKTWHFDERIKKNINLPTKESDIENEKPNKIFDKDNNMLTGNILHKFIDIIQYTTVYGFGQIGATVGETLLGILRLVNAVSSSNIKLPEKTIWSQFHEKMSPNIKKSYNDIKKSYDDIKNDIKKIFK